VKAFMLILTTITMAGKYVPSVKKKLRRGSDMERTKAQRDLFLDIWMDLSDFCENLCIKQGDKQCEAACSTRDDWKTAIMSLDDPANWPQVFNHE
jgi:hypothetical protein